MPQQCYKRRFREWRMRLDASGIACQITSVEVLKCGAQTFCTAPEGVLWRLAEWCLSLTTQISRADHLRAARDQCVKTTLERCGPFSLVVLSQRRSQVTPLSGHSDQNASETFSNKLQLNKVQSSLRQTSAKTTQVRSKAKTS